MIFKRNLMKKHLSKTTLLTATILLSGWFWSCESKIPLDDDLINEPLSINQIKVNVADTASVITIERAGEIASKFAKSNFTGSRSESREIGEVYSVKDSLGNASMYIVNFANSKGFVIVSANKGYYPVIAQSDVGHFNIPDSNHPASVWVKEQSQYISHCSELPSEIKADVARSWNEYAPEEVLITCSRSDYPPIPQVYYDSLKMWTISGEYSGVYRYNDFIKTDEYRQLTDEEKQQMINNMHMYGNACYGPVEDVTIVLIKPIYKQYYPTKLLQSQWSQLYPYNTLVPKGYPLGCTTIAAAQIMRYHQWPLTYDWNNIPVDGDYISLSRNSFLYDVANNIGVSFSYDGTSATIVDVQTAIVKYGYNATSINHNADKVRSEIGLRRPVFMGGVNSEKRGHAWVCDGVERYDQGLEIRVMSLPYRPTSYSTPTDMTEVMNISRIDYASGCRYHMNWGMGGQGDGFFRDDNISFSMAGDVLNFGNNRMELIIVPRK